MVVAVVIGGVFLAGMVAAAVYAAWALPPGARVPLNAGTPSSASGCRSPRAWPPGSGLAW